MRPIASVNLRPRARSRTKVSPHKRFGNRWEVIQQLTEAGQSYVYLVRDLCDQVESPAVLKRLKNPKRLARLKTEIEALRRLQHPGIAPVLDYSLNDSAYFVTKFYSGTTLEKAAPLSIFRSLDVFIQLCEVVGYAHVEGITHRDLKPENVMLTSEGRVVVLDFGLCYVEDVEGRLTETMEQVGSRFYMAPELEAGRAERVTPKADTYALGKILYYLLTAKHLAREAYTGDSDVAALLQDPQLKYVTDYIFTASILQEAEQRRTVQELIQRTRRVRRLIYEHFYPGREGSQCRFCGEGTYQPYPKTRVRVSQPGITHDVKFEAVVCPACGNIQWFVSNE